MSGAMNVLVAAALLSACGVQSQTIQPPSGTYKNGVVPNPVTTASGAVVSGASTTYPTGTYWNGTAAVFSAGTQGYGLVANAAAQAALMTASSSQCNFIEGAFEEGFQFPTLNTTRWKPIAVTQLDHCPTPGAVGAANAATCTAMVASQIQLAAQLPGYPTGDVGMIMSLSQTPCQKPGNCCAGNQCANWAGAHLSSQGCIHYGVLETEAAFNIPPSNGGVAFFGTYMYAGSPDPSWNEIDQTFINGATGLEFHASLFLSNPPNQNAATEDKDVYDSTGQSCLLYTPPAGQPGNLKGNSAPYTCPTFSTSFAATYHTYKLIWTPTWLAWTVDNMVYRNSTASPWRPVTMRPLLRTNVGTAASVAALPDANVYVRRIRYTPLTAAPGGNGFVPHYSDPVVRNALSCTSMASCFGSMQSSAAGLMQLTAGSATAGAAAGRRRHLLQSSAPALVCTGSNCVPAVSSQPTNLTAYQQELASATIMAQNAVAGTLVDGNVTILPSQVSVSVTGHTLIGVMFLRGIPYSFWNAQLQNAFVQGLASDVIPTPDQVYVTGTSDASLLSSWCSWGASNMNPQICTTALTYDYPFPAGTGYAAVRASVPLVYPPTAVSSTEEWPNNIGAGGITACPSWSTSGTPPTSYCNSNYSIYTNVFTPGCTQTSCPTPPAGGVFAGTTVGGAYVTINPLQGILVSWTVDGYNCNLIPSSSATCNDGGYSYAFSDMQIVNQMQSGTAGVGGSNAYQAMYAALIQSGIPASQLTNFGVSDESPGIQKLEGQPAISAVVNVNINVQYDAQTAVANSSRTDILEAMFNSALNSGTLNTAIGSNITVTPPTNVQSVRATRVADNLGGCPVYNPVLATSAFNNLVNQCSKSTTYEAVAIAFVIAFAASSFTMVGLLIAIRSKYGAGIIATANTIRSLSTRGDFATMVASSKTPQTDL